MGGRERPPGPGGPIEPIQEIDEDCWFRGRAATVRAVVEPAWAITEADLALPVVLASDGQVLDGMHRIAKAVLQRRTTVPARQPLVDPEPDWFLSGEERQ